MHISFDKPQLSVMARRLAAAAKERNLEIGHARSLELIAAMLGYRSKDVLLAELKQAPAASTPGAGALPPEQSRSSLVMLENALAFYREEFGETAVEETARAARFLEGLTAHDTAKGAPHDNRRDYLAFLLGADPDGTLTGFDEALGDALDAHEQRDRSGDHTNEDLALWKQDLDCAVALQARLLDEARRLGLLPGETDEPEINTRITWVYRDADNYKAVGRAVLKGRLSDGEKAEFHAALSSDDGHSFIPGQVGLQDLQDSFRGCESEWVPERDHPWHEVSALEDCDEEPTVPLTAQALFAQVRNAVWNESHRPPSYDVMLGRYVARLLGESLDPADTIALYAPSTPVLRDVIARCGHAMLEHWHREGCSIHGAYRGSEQGSCLIDLTGRASPQVVDTIVVGHNVLLENVKKS